ncbi:MAG: hypothetical protein ACR2J3_00070 [Aridibacter sp.]
MKKIIFLVVLIFPLMVFSQKTTPKVLTEKEQKIQIQKIQVVSMVEKTAEEAVFYEDKITAVEVMAEAADLLWDENPVQSAKWLTKAWKTIDEISESPKDVKQQEFFTNSDRSRLQTIVLGVAHKHDTKLAEKFLKEIAEKKTDENDKKGAFDDKTARSEQLLSLAQQAVDTNPNLAYSLAERSLIDGISYKLQNVLTSLRQKDVNLANRLFDAALNKFTNTSFDTSEAQILGGYLFKSGVTVGTNSGGGMILVLNPEQQNLPSVAQSEPQRARNFLSVVYQKFFSRPTVIDSPESKKLAGDVLLLGRSVVGYYNQYAPELAQTAAAFVAQLQSLISPNNQNQTPETESKLSSLPKDATAEERYNALIEDLVEKAEKETDPVAKKIAFIRAALATKREDYIRGIKIAKQIEDENLQEDAVSFLLYRAALYFIQQNEIEKAEELAPQIKEVLRRSVVKIAVAQSLLERQKDKKIEQFQLDLEKRRAFDLLNEVEKDLKKEDASQNMIKTLLGATAVMGEFDKAQAIGLLEQAVPAINKTANYNLKNDSAPRLGIDISSTSSATVDNPKIGFGFRSAVEPLLETDFEQIVSIIERFSAKETRGISRLEVAKLFFQNNKDLLKQK